ncbi:helix-turn-helix domain-containing protein [Streptomyces chromofuscus]|uniref:Helix-turn-helix domain-containing protein n=1 Tax=Streptomyces chromofuscus TaxID=42881 RepID=A0A7M2THH3_STRCW|nr:helix-turn-helix domain-containing protein [Streptomyces chromofuscus]
MLVTDFRTADLPVAERFGSWHDMTAKALIPNVIRSDHEADFRARARVLQLGDLQVSALAYPALETRRSTQLIRRSDPDGYQMMLSLRGGHRILQAGRDSVCGAGDMMLYDTSRPWHGWTADDSDRVKGVMVAFPRALLPLPADELDRLTAVPLPGREGLGAVLSGYLVQLTAGAAAYTPADDSRLAACTLDLLTAYLAHYLDADASVPPSARHKAQLLQIRAFVQRHLDDPDLSPGAIAAAHHMSLRSLHRLFQQEGLTVAGWIRGRRLESCRRDLADPLLRSRSVRAIAARWGFSDPAHFSRAFRAAYGMSPGEYRHLVPTGLDSSMAGAKSPADAPA